MYSSSSRVKLNRVALKDVVGLKLVPRRRRVSKSPNNVSGDSTKQEEKQQASEMIPVRHDNEPASSCLAAQQSVSNITEEEPEDRGGLEDHLSDTKDQDHECKTSTSDRDIVRNMQPSSTGLSDSEGSLRKTVTPSCCDLCADCEYISPQKKALGDHTNRKECRTSMWDGNVVNYLGSGCDLTGVENHRGKIIELGDGVKEELLPFTTNLESISCNGIIEKETTCSGMSDDNQSAELTCEWSDSFTCQRVRVYCKKVKFSCARTYMPWPFSNSSHSLTAHAGTAAFAAEPIHPSARNNRRSPINQNQSGSPSSQITVMLPNASADPSSETTHQGSYQNEEGEEHTVAKRNERRRGNMSSCTSESKNAEFAPHLNKGAESPDGLLSDRTTPLPLGQGGCGPGTDTVSTWLTPLNEPEIDSSTSTPSLSALGLSDVETSQNSSYISSLFTQKKVKGVELAEAHSITTSPTSSSPKCGMEGVEKPLFFYEETQMPLYYSSSRSPSVLLHNSDSFQSCESSLLLPQDEQESDKGNLTDRSPPKLEPYYNTNPVNQNWPFAFGKVTSSSHNISEEQCEETDLNELMFPPLLSPVTSPQKHLESSCLSQNQCSSPTSRCKTLSSFTSFVDVNMSNKEQSQDKTDSEDDVEQNNKAYKPVPLDSKMKVNPTSGVVSSPCDSPSSDEGQSFSPRSEATSPSELDGSENDSSEAEAAGDGEPSILDEFTAYKQDILLVNVIQDDPDLFENLPAQSLLKLGPTRVGKAANTRPAGTRIDGASLEFKQKLTPVIAGFRCDIPDITEEKNSRDWRPQCNSSTCPATAEKTRNMDQADANNNNSNTWLESRSQPIQTVNSSQPNSSTLGLRNGTQVWNSTLINMTDPRQQKSNGYCREYFSDSLSCSFNMSCRYRHVPVEGDEKLCIETVVRFLKTQMCLQKAGAVFTQYYQSNTPGLYFSKPVLVSLLWALLKAGMVPDVFSVLRVSLTHKIVPDHEFLLALFNTVRERRLLGSMPELIQLTFKMASAGLGLSLDCLDCVKNIPEFQQTVDQNSAVSVSGNLKLSTSAPSTEYLNLAQSIVEIELCTKQEDWKQMGEVFRAVFQTSPVPNQVEQICGRIAIALLSESKDKLSLPFAAFAETVCQNEVEGTMIRSFLGRIGVSLMLRYHKTHQWAKGRKVVEVLALTKVNYSTLKGLFGNEDGTSRCHLITVAAELFLLSGSMEGALTTLRENNWFLGSCLWPCDLGDLDRRSHVLMRLAEKTSHRETLEVLSNLPGIKEPNDSIDVSRYTPLFHSHLQVCLDRQMLLLASHTVDFMHSKKLSVDHAMLHILLHKMGKQKLWLRAREVFRNSLSVGYYPGLSAPPGGMVLNVPCQLGEVELALTFEMFVTVNRAAILQFSETNPSCLSITLKRSQSGESEYLSAGSRLLSAACIPQPQLIIHYSAVNSSKEQMFTLDISSARCWLHRNHWWASVMWTPNSYTPAVCRST